MRSKIFTFGQWSIAACLISIAISPPIANLFFFIALFTLIFSGNARNNLVTFFRSRVGKAFFLFSAILISGLFYGIEERRLILNELWGWRKILCIPLAASFFINQSQAQRKLLTTYLYSMGVFSSYSFIVFFYPEFAITKLYGPGIVARNHVTQGIMFSFAALIGFRLVIENFNKDLNKTILLSLITLSISINVMQIATGRSGHIALLVSLLCFLYMFGWFSLVNRNWIKGAMTLTIVAMMMIASPAINDRFKLMHTEYQTSINQDTNTSIGLRLTFWRNTIEMASNTPTIFGVGTGGFAMAYQGHILKNYDNSTETKILTTDPHNQYLKIIIEQGILGLLIFGVLQISLFIQGLKLSNGKLIGIPILLSIIITSFFNSHFSTFNEGMLVYLFCGALLTSQNLGASLQDKPS